jgi:hypothetical protein
MNLKGLLVATISITMLGACASDTANENQEAGTSLVDSILGSADAESGVAAPASGAKLNPAHGEPDHRCEIPVGAPLDSEPGSYVEPNLTMTPTTMPQPAAAPVTPPPAQVDYDKSLTPAQMLAKGLNPPHGEAGHKCEIAVGAPLK